LSLEPAVTPAILKYPRTYHIEGSRLQSGDEGMGNIPIAAIAGRHIVVAEKVDGGNAAISFGPDGTLLLQSRGHYLTGGPRERHFALFKRWAAAHTTTLWDAIGDRYVVYGEWLYAKHTLFYDALPHYFMEFDVRDRTTGAFLDTARRRLLLQGLPIVPVRVLLDGSVRALGELTRLVGPSAFITPDHLERLATICVARGIDAATALRETDPSMTMEGLYIKVEEGGVVVDRYKYVRPSFRVTTLDSGGHWLDRPIIPNRLAPGIDLFAP